MDIVELLAKVSLMVGAGRLLSVDIKVIPLYGQRDAGTYELCTTYMLGDKQRCFLGIYPPRRQRELTQGIHKAYIDALAAHLADK